MLTAIVTQAVLASLPIFTILILILGFKWSAAKAGWAGLSCSHCVKAQKARESTP